MVSASPSPSPAPSFEDRFVSNLFAVLLLLNLWGLSAGWTNLNLPGCEFRQAQTALSALFIQRDHDFSLAYPTPVLGKPWSIPMEFPLYQWTVVVVSDFLGLSLTSAGRAVSAACFYLTLPAFYLLLARIGLTRTLRFVVLGFVLTCPLYIFYARAFLMETMALMFGAWYLLALIQAVEKRDPWWLGLCIVAGTGVGLVKITTFILFLLPAFALSLFWLWQSRPMDRVRNWRPLIHTLGWLVAAHVIPFLAARWWVHFADSVKLLNPSGEALTSTNLAGWNFGIGQRFSPELWAAHWRIFFHELISPMTAVLCVVAAFFVSRKWIVWSLLCLGLFLAVQLIFPILYAWHDYYYVANAFALMGAVGLIVAGLLQSGKTHRAIGLAVLVVAQSFQILAWYRAHYAEQKFRGIGGNSLTTLLKDITEPDEAIVMAGEDWNSMTPYYAERRALLLRDDILRSTEKFDAAFANMKGTPVAVLVLRDAWRNNRGILNKASTQLGIDPRPALLWGEDQIYFHRDIRTEILAKLESKGMNRFGDFRLAPEAQVRDRPFTDRVVQYAQLSNRHKKMFGNMRPTPISFFSTIGPELWEENGEQRLFAHPETKLWFALTRGNYRLRTSIAMTTSSYVGVPWADATDGVHLIATVIDANGKRQEVQQLHVNPRDNPATRGVMNLEWPFSMPTDGQLELAVTPGPFGSSARDWTTLGAVKIDRDPSQ